MSLSHEQIAKQLVERLQHEGYTALFAGGWVRDFVLGHPSQDIDIATDAHPEKVMKLFPQSIAVGVQFGVVRVRSHNHEFEVTTFRSDDQYVDGRHPTNVKLLSSPQEDAQRRDFTINGMFYDPVTSLLYDYVGGREDIAQKLIRTIGDPYHRFTEDRLRIIRAIRFKHALQFSIEEKTWQAICQESPHVIEAVSPERVWQELQKMVVKSILAPCLRDLQKCSLLFSLFPNLKSLPQKELEERLQRVERCKEPSLIAALCLLIPQQREELVQKFHLSNKEKDIITTFSLLESLPEDELSLVSLYARPDIDLCLHTFACATKDPEHFLQIHRKRQKELSFWVKQLQTNSFLIGGDDLLALGIKPGKEMGNYIQKAFQLSLEKKITDKNKLLNLLKERLS